MSSLKPVIHGRDHLPGGADPIPVVASTFDPQSGEQHFNSTGTVPAIDILHLTLSSLGGASLVTLSGSQAFTNSKGVYAISASVQVNPPATEPAGDGVDVSIIAVQASLPLFGTGVPSPGRATFVIAGNGQSVWYGAGSTTRLMQVNDWFRVTVTNYNSYAVDVVAGVSIVRIIDLT